MIKNFKLFFWIFIILTFNITFALNAQNETGNPFITNFGVKEYKGHPQIWDIIQDSREFIYFANGDGITIFDGNDWELIRLPNKISSRALAKDQNGIIYAAGTNEIGYLQPDKCGKLKYFSLIDSLGFSDIGIIRDIITIKDHIYFRSSDYLIQLNKNGFTYWKSESTYNIAFSFNNELFIVDTKKGLFKLENEILVLAPDGKDFINKTFYFAEQFKNEIILADRTRGLYTYNPTYDKTSKLSNIVCEANKFLTENFVNTGIVTRDEKIILGTNRCGCLIINRQGDVLYNFTKNKGIQHNNVRTVYIDNMGNLWLGLNNGISRCDISLPITLWNELTGLEGIVESIIRYEETIYISTLQGIYYIENNKVHKIPGDIVQAWSFLNFTDISGSNKMLLVATTEGIYEIKNKTLVNKWTSQLSFKLYQSPSNPNIVYAGLRNNIGVLEYKKGKFEYKGTILNSGISVRTIAEDKNREIWISTYRHGVVRIMPSDDILNPEEIIHYDIKSGLPSLKDIMVFDFNNTIVFGTEFGLYRFDKNSDKFISDNTFGDIFKGEQKDVYLLVEDEDENVWISQIISKPGSIGIASKTPDGSYSWNSTPLSRIPEIGIRTILVEPSGIIWIGGTDGIFRFDNSIQKNYNKKFHTYIRNVNIKNDSTIFFGNYYIEKDSKKYFSLIQNETFKYEIDFRYNSIIFKYASPEFSNGSNLKYQYMLEGYDKNWSGWNNITTKEYTNLNEDLYKFKVRTKNIYNIISTEASFEFRILPPWYRKPTAYIGYFIIGIILIFGVVRISIRRLRIINVELERLVEKRTYEINQQKEEILTQSEELTTKNEELEKLSIVASETDNAIAIADENGNLEWVNAGFTRLYGYSFEDLNQLNYNTLVDFSISKNIKDAIDYCLQTKQSKIYESLNNSKSGKNIWAHTTITPILDENENVIKLIAIDSDITKLKLAEQEVMQQKDEIQAQRDFAQQQKLFIEEQNKELGKHRNRLEQLVKDRTIDLEIAKEKAEQSDKLKSAFLANMSHEIRTPMNAIIGFSNLLNDNNIVKEDKDELVSHIIHNSNTLLHLIDDIIDIAKIEAGQLEINKKNCQINKILNELFETFSEKKKLLHHKDLNLVFKPGIENINFTTYTDPIRIQQILINLIDNALKFTETGKIEIGYTLKEENEDSTIQFFVKDTGIGLTEEQQGQIFSRFTKFENDKKKLYRGAGLGLAICKNISNLLGGDVWVESEPKQGSTFYFTIPYLKVSENGIILKENQKENIYNWADKSILVAEDEESNFRFLEMVLSKTNVTLVRAKDGIEAIEKFQKKNIDLILMDIKMPNMDGIEATRRIRKIDEDIIIIAQTAFAMENDEKMSVKAGCNDYIAKPIRKSKLLKLINKYLS